MTQLTVLGSCGAWPEPGRACAGFLLSHNGFHVVLDLGYGTVSRLLAHTAARDVGAVVITHEHPDHMADLSALGRAWHYTVQAAPSLTDPDARASRGHDAEGLPPLPRLLLPRLPLPRLPLFCTPGTLRRLEATEPRPHPTTIFDVRDLSSGRAHAFAGELSSERPPGSGPEHGAAWPPSPEPDHGATPEPDSGPQPSPGQEHSSARELGSQRQPRAGSTPGSARQPSLEPEHGATPPPNPEPDHGAARQPSQGPDHGATPEPDSGPQPSPGQEHSSARELSSQRQPSPGSAHRAARELGSEWDVGPFRLTSVLLPHYVPNHGVRLSAPGLNVVYSGDCGPSRLLVELARGADLLICDATLQGEPPTDEPRQLMTAAEAGRTAAEAKVGTLLLTHFWPGTDRAVSVAEARAEFPGDVLVADEGLTLTL
ncbi:MBL fold metallo-hydrolase [Amycolatopsis sp. NBC_00345]|uniref:MBL fold metallo-hydrolase n=1 Tax=Amycolatopsis sp. NBC_00345 TaxID=2975955 RepID=UPI003FA46D3A